MQSLTRALRLFGDIRDDEVGRVVRLMLGLFALMFGYYVLKTVREPLILATGGAELKAYAAGAQAIALMLAVSAYGALASRVPRATLIRRVLSLFIACIVLFAVAAHLQVPMLGFLFYVWVGIFSLATLAQFWSFANDLFSPPQGERLFAFIAIGQATGAAAGSKLAELLFEQGTGVIALLAIAAALIVVHLWLFPFYALPDIEGSSRRPLDDLRDGRGGFRLVLSSPYLRSLAVLLVLLNLVNTTGEYILGKVALETAREQLQSALAAGRSVDKNAFLNAEIGSFYGSFFFDVNLVVVLVQALVVSRLVKYVGFAGILFMLPLVSLGTYAAAGMGVSVLVFRWLKLAENSTDYSIMNTAKAMAWLPTSRAAKYKAKQAVDTFFVRTGDMLSAAVVFVGTELLTWRRGDFAWFNVAVALVWLGLSWAIARHYRRQSKPRRGESRSRPQAQAP